MIVRVSEGWPQNLVLASVEWAVRVVLCACSSASFSTNGISYQRVCGRARGYQKGDTTGFYGAYINELNDQNYENYVAGLSITYSSARQHIWTFANGQGETLAWSWNCRCTYTNAFVPS